MKFKIDTKEKFVVITPVEALFADNVAVAFEAVCNDVLIQPIKNAILNLQHVQFINEQSCEAIAAWQQKFYESNASFVICCLQPEVEAVFEKMELNDVLNSTPTESEAWDIVQMEEIERELMDGDDITFATND